MKTAAPSLALWEQWFGRRGSLRTQLIVWNILALTVLLGILGTVLNRQTVHSFLMASVNSELERQAQRVRLPPPRRERGPRPDDLEGPPAFEHLRERQFPDLEDFPHRYDLSSLGENRRASHLHHLRYDEVQGPPLRPPHEHGEGRPFPGPREFGGRPGPPPFRESGPYRPHHFDLQGRSIVPSDDRPIWDPAGFTQAKQGRRRYATVVVDGEALQVLSDPVRERGVIVAVVQVAQPLAGVQLAIGVSTARC